MLKLKLRIEIILSIFFSTGTPGSGKSTQCKKLAEQFALGHISKDILSREVEAGTERGLKIAELLKNKESVPDVSCGRYRTK